MAADPSRVVVAVATTSTVVIELDVRDDGWVTLQVDNLNAAQTFNGTIERRQSSLMAWVPSTLSDFEGVGPLTGIVADLDVSGTGFMRLVGAMSGAGGDVAVCARKGWRKP